MSTVQAKPQLMPGMHLNCDEFLERWYAIPDLKYAELINGVVHMPSPVSHNHGRNDYRIAEWTAGYLALTPGIEGMLNTTWLMGEKNAPQPDLSLRILPGYGGQSKIKDQLITGTPELSIEIAYTSAHHDLGEKLKVYEAAGVQEYIVVLVATEEIRWHQLIDGKYELLLPDKDGLWHSKVFPGLWLDEQTVFQEDRTRLLEVLKLGLQSPEHAAFVERLQQAKVG